MANIIVLGAGGWGLGLASAFCGQGHSVTVWSAFADEAEHLRIHRSNDKLLSGVKLDDSVQVTSDLSCAADSDIAVIAVPSFAVRETAARLKGKIGKKTVVVNVAKGFEPDTLKCLSQVIAEELPDNKVVVLSGPSHAEEVALGVPTSLVAACADRKTAEYVQDKLMSPTLRIYSHDDVRGVEVGGALKNVIAVCYGICDGMNVGDNTKAALMTRGLSEIASLGVKMGAREETFAGLTGIGDLIVTCMSMHSRNHRFGILIGRGMDSASALDEIGMTVEGYHCAKTAYELAEKYGAEMPITEQCYNVLYKNTDPKAAVSKLMQRPKRHERETSFLT